MKVEGFEWAKVDSPRSSPFLLRVGVRNSLNLFDVRTGKNRLELAQFEDGECLGGFCRSCFSPFQMYCTTNRGTKLLDERFTGKPLSQWDHPASKDDCDVPAGCDAVMVAENRFEKFKFELSKIFEPLFFFCCQS